MKTKLTIELTERPDGNGKPVRGWYLCDYGYPVGCAYKTYEEAKVIAPLYLADIRNMIRETA